MKDKHEHSECCEHNHDACSCEHNHEHSHDSCGCGCGHDHERELDKHEKNEVIFKLATSVVFFILGIIASKVEFFAQYEFIALICFGISYLFVGFNIIKEAVEGVIHGNIFNENFLMTIASLGAFAIKEYSEGCAVMILFTFGEFMQSIALGKSRNAIKSMLKMKPTEVTVIRNGEEVTVKPEEVEIGETIVVKPGEKINLDGEIIEGNCELDMAALTGESIPVSVGAGDKVLSGSVCINATLKVRAEKKYSDGTIAQILEMLEHAQNKKSSTEKFITKFAKIYTPIVCAISLLIILVPPIFFGGDWNEWIYNGLSALVASCPCAIVISVPLSFFGGLGACSKQGILVKGSNYLEELTKCNIGVFDKTGTITSGKFKYVSCEGTDNERELFKIISACEKYSTHPIAKSICLAFGQYSENAEVKDAKNYAGMGVSAIVDGVEYFVGNEKLMRSLNIDFKETQSIGTAVYCATKDKFVGNIVFADIIKEDSKDAVRELKKLGVKKTYMLTGDKKDIAQDIAKKAGITNFFSKLLPQDKVKKMEEIKKEGKVFYTGDGINDAPVLASADIGIAMGGVGSDIAIEASDIVIMGDSLSKIPKAIKIARQTMAINKENIIFALLVKAVIIALAAFGISEMWLAVFGDVGVCLIAVANSLRTMITHRK